jgi:16S rRNA (uracil1498-N3)-methyltransferase
LILFYTNNISDKIATLEGDEAMHCMKTLRKKVGDAISFVDGNGGWYEGKLVSTSKKSCTIAIEKQTILPQRADYYLHIAIAPTKNINRLEWFLEKCTEIGIDEITPILCQRSERKNIRLDRLEKILVAAMKQSLKAYLPKLNELTKLSDCLKNANPDEKFIAHCNDGEKVHLKNAYSPRENVLILIGPEGDFSNEEVDLALENDFKAITLGKERLRTETAGIVACHSVRFLNN